MFKAMPSGARGLSFLLIAVAPTWARSPEIKATPRSLVHLFKQGLKRIFVTWLPAFAVPSFAAVAMFVAFSNSAEAKSLSPTTTRIIVPFTPGGFPDRIARILANEMSAHRPNPVIVENRPGASGIPGALYVSRAEPDGSVLLMGSLPTYVLAPLLNPRVDFDPIKDLSHLSYIGGPPNAFVVDASSPISSLSDLIERSRKSPLRYGTAGVGSVGHLNAAFVAQAANIDVIHVPYNGPMINDILAGSVDFGSLTASTVLGQIDGGLLRAIAVGTARRLPKYQDVPTFKELGYDIDSIAWLVLSGPRNMAPELQLGINQEISSILREPKLQEVLRQELIEPIPMTPDEVTSLIATDTSKWSSVVASMGLASNKP